MDYQASSSGSKAQVVSFVSSAKKGVTSLLLLSFAFLSVCSAQTTTNPLTESVYITSDVLFGPITYPDTRPITPIINTVITPDTSDSVIFRGIAYPGSTITLLKNGQTMAQIPASPNGTFEIRVRNLDGGTYTFSVRAEDESRLTSKLVTFTLYLTTGITTVIDGIFIPPTITTDKSEVKRGDIITFLGSAVPSADLRLSLHSDTEILKKTQSNASGTWIYKMDSSELELGDHEGKARSITSNDVSLYSDSVLFRVGDTNKNRSKSLTLNGFRKRCDLNGDNRVNLLDFSIMAFWYKRLGFPDKVDLNTDQRVNLTDLSILAYCWTG
jgi:hypothetical protein